jgi:hypothetical protein
MTTTALFELREIERTSESPASVIPPIPMAASTNDIESRPDGTSKSAPVEKGGSIEPISDEPAGANPDTQLSAGKPGDQHEGIDQRNIDREEPKMHRGVQFWCIMFALGVTGILSALEGTVVGTALPAIINDLGGAELYIWTINGYFLTS